MILVFGRSGQVATELTHRPDVIALGRDDADLARQGTASLAIAAHAPDVVINAAAYTAVDLAESHVDAARQLNAEVPGEMARACAARGIPFLTISTDYVFDGSGNLPRNETAGTQPLNVYGRSKLAGEQAVREAGGHSLVLRTSWVFSAHGSNFLKTMLTLANSKSHLRIVSDQIGGPTPAADIAATLLALGEAMRRGAAGGVYHYAGTPSVSWADFARTIFDMSGRGVQVEDISTQDYPTPAIRPLNSRLDCAKLACDFGISQPSWRNGLKSALKDLDA